jgi:hypothetical protein
MVNRIISDFLGPFVVILQYTKTRPWLITVVFAAYLLTYGLGIYQLRGIRKKTYELISEKYNEWKGLEPNLSDKVFIERFMPLWEAKLKEMRYLYIMNKFDLWPVRITLKNVMVKFPLDIDTIREYLTQKEELTTK